MRILYLVVVSILVMVAFSGCTNLPFGSSQNVTVNNSLGAYFPNECNNQKITTLKDYKTAEVGEVVAYMTCDPTLERPEIFYLEQRIMPDESTTWIKIMGYYKG